MALKYSCCNEDTIQNRSIACKIDDVIKIAWAGNIAGMFWHNLRSSIMNILSFQLMTSCKCLLWKFIDLYTVVLVIKKALFSSFQGSDNWKMNEHNRHHHHQHHYHHHYLYSVIILNVLFHIVSRSVCKKGFMFQLEPQFNFNAAKVNVQANSLSPKETDLKQYVRAP